MSSIACFEATGGRIAFNPLSPLADLI